MGISIRAALVKDREWMVSELQEGAKQRHFGPLVGVQGGALFNEIIVNGGFQMLKLRGGINAPCFVNASISVAELDGEPISFIISLIDRDEVEIHLAGTKKRYRRQGGFMLLLKNEINKYGKSIKIYARCYKKSTWAIDALRHGGFAITKMGDPVELTFARED